MPKIDTNELEALKAKAREVEVEIEEVKVKRLRVIIGFLTQLKWLIIGGGAAFILAKIHALPHSFQEVIDGIGRLIPKL